MIFAGTKMIFAGTIGSSPNTILTAANTSRRIEDTTMTLIDPDLNRTAPITRPARAASAPARRAAPARAAALALALAPAAASAQTILADFHNPATNKRCFLLSHSTRTQAAGIASSMGGHLVTIGDAAENAWVTGTFAPLAFRGALWIGLSRPNVMSAFSWDSGDPVAYLNWYPGEPSGGTQCNMMSEVYARIDAPFFGGRWGDAIDDPVLCWGIDSAINGVVQVRCPVLGGGLPMDAVSCPSGGAAFSVSASGDGPFTYQWQIEDDGLTPPSWISVPPLPPPPQEVVVTLSRGREVYCHIQSANNEIILRSESAGSTRLRCLVSNACGGVTSLPATFTVCIADTDDGSGTGACDGGVTIEDLIYYLGIFDAGLPGADVDDGSAMGTPDGGVTIEDLLYYLARFDAGC